MSVGNTGGFNSIIRDIPSASSAYDPAYYAEGSASYGGVQKTLSVRNVASILPPSPGTTGNTAEAYEVTDYSAQVETRDIRKTCGHIKDLKSFSYVIFENASESDKRCSYTFKVEHKRVAEVLSAIKALDPKDLTENTNTIKQLVDDFTSQTDILKKKRDSIDRTLDSALHSYDEITALATRTQNAEALAKIIDSKIGIIERLTQERININAQLDGLSRAKEDQLDRLKYTYFNVNAYEYAFFDGESIKDSWKASLKSLWLLPLLVYALIVLIVAKYTWRAAKHIWTG